MENLLTLIVRGTAMAAAPTVGMNWVNLFAATVPRAAAWILVRPYGSYRGRGFATEG